MADNKKQNYTLNTELRLEPLLVSFKRDNYKEMCTLLLNSLKEYDPQLIDILNKYMWLIEQQLQGNIPSVEVLKREFPNLIFDNVAIIESNDELSDYVYMYISQKKHRFLATQFLVLSDKVRTQGLSDEDTANVYRYLADSENTSDFVSVNDNYMELYTAHKNLVGISFLCPELDDLTGGITPGQVCTILGAPGSMKTTYSSNIAYNAIKSGKNVLYLSLEEPEVQLFNKWMSRCSMDQKTPLDRKDIELHKLDEKQLDTLNNVYKAFKQFPGRMYIVDEQKLTDRSIMGLESKFKELDKKAIEDTGHGIDLLVVDHIQLFKFAYGQKIDATTTINMYVSFLRQQALSWLHEKRQISVIMLSQANRDGYTYAQKNGGQYQSQHVAEASEVERASAYIISVYTDPMTQATSQLILGAVKLRGASLPPGPIPIYENAAYYLVGTPTNDNGETFRQVDESQVSFDDIDSILIEGGE